MVARGAGSGARRRGAVIEALNVSLMALSLVATAAFSAYLILKIEGYASAPPMSTAELYPPTFDFDRASYVTGAAPFRQPLAGALPHPYITPEHLVPGPSMPVIVLGSAASEPPRGLCRFSAGSAGSSYACE